MKKIMPYERKTYFYETDKMSIMHHSNYIRIFEETRVDMMRQSGMPFTYIEEAGLMMPVLSVSCTFRSPLRFDEPFAVYPHITRFNGVKLELSYRIVSRESGLLCAEGTSSHCFTDLSMKPVRIKHTHPDIYSLFAEYAGYEVTD
ncbi:MAG: acyl-CoA thioesterase [Ruminococcus sp.]|nr:acyl-CoA thioesterase [Ruminococcus sp.]